jgi:hypothetical protein
MLDVVQHMALWQMHCPALHILMSTHGTPRKKFWHHPHEGGAVPIAQNCTFAKVIAAGGRKDFFEK